MYIAGPYTQGDTLANVAAALKAAEWVVERGGVPFIPHLSHFWQASYHHDYSWWLDYDVEWLRACHYLLRIPGYSPGANKEVYLAESVFYIPVLYWSNLIGTSFKFPLAPGQTTGATPYGA
uniref:DUF7768 domain-containing protein n=1 Tax=viral metagenome TaxID=1070528 RepID=A0A6M3IL59_9ZZZZ